MHNNSNKTKLFTRRTILLWISQIIAFIALLGRYAYLQLNQGSRLKTLADNNHIKIKISPGPRGSILDRKGLKIAHDINSYQLVLNEEYIKELEIIIGRIEGLLGITTDVNKYGIEKVKNRYKNYKSQIIIQSRLTWKQIAIIAEDMYFFNKVEIEETKSREYPYNCIFGHVSGYIGAASTVEIEAKKLKNMSKVDIGKNGLEKQYEENLRGLPSLKRVEVDVQGYLVRNLENIPGRQGKTLITSLDVRIQEILVKAIEDKRGSIVVLDVNTGQVLGMYSFPSYDPNLFIRGLDNKTWNKIINDPDHPLINKAVSATYPPGSTFKLVTALSILDSNIVKPSDAIFCNGAYRLGKRVAHCWKEHGHGSMNFIDALSHSCNVYFYTHCRSIGIERIARIASILGLGNNTEIDLPFEVSGLIPTKQWKKTKKNQSWHGGDTLNVAIGQGDALVTPLQLAVMSARIATGREIKPSLLGEITKKQYPILKIPSYHLDLVRNAISRNYQSPAHLITTIDSSTGWLAGKTGTGQISLHRKTSDDRLKDHSIFTGYFPHRRPKYAISIIIENGGWGSENALPIAKNVIAQLAENSEFWT